VGQAPSRIPRYGITPGSRPWFLVMRLHSLAALRTAWSASLHSAAPSKLTRTDNMQPDDRNVMSAS
jgi:hypothetical protein